MGKLETLDDVKKDISEEGIKEVNILFLDVSSTCTGYAIMSVNFHDKSSKLTKCGALWLSNKDWRDQEKYSYLFNAISQYFWIAGEVDYIVAEQYSINPNKMVGVQVLPEMMGVIKTAGEENGINVSSILPQTWRAQLGIKPNVTLDKNGKKKKDYKQPTKEKVLEHFEIPEKSVSNLTGKERNTPSDLYDAVAIGLGWTKKYGLDKLLDSEPEVNPHIGMLEHFTKK